MQLIALETGSPIYAARAVRGKNYLCPECKAVVRVRSGPSRQIHFYHLSRPHKCSQHEKSLEHVQLQLKLNALLPHSQLECPFPTIGRIADVAWHVQKCVFEIQCSPMPLEEAKARVADYRKAGYRLIWILHDKRFNRKNVSAAEHFLRTTPCYFGNGRVIYDQFEIIKWGKRMFKGPPLSVSIGAPLAVPSLEMALPDAFLTRIESWKCYMPGDLFHHFLQNPSGAQKMFHFETRKKTHFSLVRFYHSLLSRLLMKFSK